MFIAVKYLYISNITLILFRIFTGVKDNQLNMKAMKGINELSNGVLVAVVSKNGKRDVYMFNAYFEFEGRQFMSYHAYLDYDGEVVDEPGATLYYTSFDTIEEPTAEEIEMFESQLNERGLYFDEENGILAGY